MRRLAAVALIAMLLSGNLALPSAVRADDKKDNDDPASKFATQTPIKHLVVIFDENNSFDHYFGTYPSAKANMDGSVYFTPKADTPAVNGLTPTLLTNNPNFLKAGANPFRLDRTEALTCNNTNSYTLEQQDFDSGFLDEFALTSKTCSPPNFSAPDLAMGYYDGNTVTALWNYAQSYAMSDNFFDTEFGVTEEGHLNLLSGQTNGVIVKVGPVGANLLGNGTAPPNVCTTTLNTPVACSVIGNMQPYYDDCAVGVTPNTIMTGRNVGDLMNARNISWGWFYGDFGPVSGAGVSAVCVGQYNSHYAPFDYYQSTANPHHTQPSLATIGTDTCTNFACANHTYDLTWFYQGLSAGILPAVTYLKFAENDTGHPSDSTPLLEQTSIVTAINAIEQSPFWRDTAIMITYDDSDGWYDHVAGPIVNPSNDPTYDAITGTPGVNGSCSGAGKLATGALNDRCGFGVRLPFLLISPFAKPDYVDHSLNDTTSILRFIEYNWNLGTIGDPTSFDVLASGTILGMFDFDNNNGNEGAADSRKVILDPTYGTVVGP